MSMAVAVWRRRSRAPGLLPLGRAGGSAARACAGDGGGGNRRGEAARLGFCGGCGGGICSGRERGEGSGDTDKGRDERSVGGWEVWAALSEHGSSCLGRKPGSFAETTLKFTCNSFRVAFGF